MINHIDYRTKKHINYVTINNKLTEKLHFYGPFPYYNTVRLCIAMSQKRIMIQLSNNASQLLSDIQRELDMNKNEAHLEYEEFEALVRTKHIIENESECAKSIVESIKKAEQTFSFMFN